MMYGSTAHAAARNLVTGGLNNLMGERGLLEVLDNLKEEFKNLSREAKLAKQQRDESERKLQAQLTELNSITERIIELEKNYTRMKTQYEEEISKLRREIELHGGNVSDKGLPSSTSGPYTSNGTSSSGTFFSGSVGGLAPIDIQRSYQSSATSSSQSGMMGGSVAGTKRPREEGHYPGSSPASSAVTSGSLFPHLHSFGSNPSQSSSPATKYLKSGPGTSPYSMEIEDKSKLHPPGPGTSSSLSSSSLYGTHGHLSQNPSPYLPSFASSSGHSSYGHPTAHSSMNHPTHSAHPSHLSHLPHSSHGLSASHQGSPAPQEKSLASGDSHTKREDLTGDKKKSSDWVVGHNPRAQTSMELELTHTLDHPSVVCCVRFSNDGKHLATGCNKSAQIFDTKTGAKIHTFSEDPQKGTDLYIRSVVFSPDNRLLVAGAEDKTVKIWDIAQKKMKAKLLGHSLDIYSVDFSRDGNTVVSGSGDKKAKLWDVERGECLFTLGDEENGPKDGVTYVTFSPDGKQVAVGSLDRIVRIWDVTSGQFIRKYEGHLDSVYSIAFSPDGKSLVSGSLDKTLKLWDLTGSRSRSKCKATFSAHTDFVLSVAFSPDGKWIISGSKDHSVMFWDPNNSAASMMVLHGHKNSVISVAVSPAGEPHFATGSGDCRAKLWKYRFSE